MPTSQVTPKIPASKPLEAREAQADSPSQSSKENNPADSSILDFLSIELCDNKSLLFKPSSFGILSQQL